MTGEKAHPAVARDRWAKRARAHGSNVPSTPPVVTWRALGCRCLVLSVYLTPDGWAVDGRDFKIPVPEWIEKVKGPEPEQGLTEYRAGQWGAFAPGEVHGLSDLLPLDVSTWKRGSHLELGCPHGYGTFPTADLRADCQQAKTTRRPVKRSISWASR